MTPMFIAGLIIAAIGLLAIFWTSITRWIARIFKTP